MIERPRVVRLNLSTDWICEGTSKFSALSWMSEAQASLPEDASSSALGAILSALREIILHLSFDTSHLSSGDARTNDKL